MLKLVKTATHPINDFLFTLSPQFIWLVTFLAVVCFGIDIGLITGAIFSVFTIVLRFYHPKSRLLGQLPYTEIYLDIHQHRAVKEIPGVKIIQFTSPLFFMNKDMFQESVLKRTLKNQTFKGCSEGFDYGPVNTLVLDCSSMCFIDTNGVEAIAEVGFQLENFKGAFQRPVLLCFPIGNSNFYCKRISGLAIKLELI